LFGSITTADISESLAKAGFEVEKRTINMSEAIRHIGEYDVSVTLHSSVSVAIKVVVEAQEEE
jgi:large subunit ribosomal protein L9